MIGPRPLGKMNQEFGGIPEIGEIIVPELMPQLGGHVTFTDAMSLAEGISSFPPPPSSSPPSMVMLL